MSATKLVINMSQLEERASDLPKRLSKLVPHSKWLGTQRLRLPPATVILAVHEGVETTTDYGGLRVMSQTPRLAINYSETWQYVGRRRLGDIPGLREAYILKKAYLHTYLAFSPDEEQQFVFIHCDPQRAPGTDHHRYMVGPHMHLKIAESPWDRAHIALCDGWTSTVLDSLMALDEAIVRAVDLIADEFVPLLNEH